MKIECSPYEIELKLASDTNLNSSLLNQNYDFVYHDENYPIFKGTQFEIKLLDNGNIIKNILINSLGKNTMFHNNTIWLDHDKILICCGNKVFHFQIPEMKLIWSLTLDPVACYEFYKIPDGFIAHGEITISKFNLEGQLLWQTEFLDIIGDNEDKKHFMCSSDNIEIIDFSDNHYIINFDGEMIEQELYHSIK
jgi:hypothetical protein